MGLFGLFKKKEEPIAEVKEEKYEYKTHMIYGEQLKNTLDSVKEFEKRDCYDQLKNFLFSNMTDRVCLVYGLRRTGKTIMMRQAMLEMSDEDREKCAYIKITINDDMKALNEDFKQLRKDGFKYVFIDEITLLDDFVDNAAILSDIYAAEGMKIVLSGTDSLAFWYTVRGELYDRAVQIHTTFISYSETKRLLKKDDFDEYIREGGTLSPSPLFADIDATSNYIDTSIVRNIRRSVKGSEEMDGQILQVMEAIAYNYVLAALNDKNASYDFHVSARYLKNQQENKFKLDTTIVNQIRDYLKAIDCTTLINDSNRLVFTQPGMMYSKVEAIIDELMTDRHYVSMSDVERVVFLGNLHGAVLMMLRDDYGSLDENSYKVKIEEPVEVSEEPVAEDKPEASEEVQETETAEVTEDTEATESVEASENSDTVTEEKADANADNG